MESSDEEPEDYEPSTFALGLTMSVVVLAASYWTATIVFALMGRTGIPLSPLLLIVPAIPANMAAMRWDEKLSPGRGKNRLTTVAIYLPGVLALILVVVAPLPVLVDTIPVGGAFGLTVTACVLAVVLIIARVRRRSRE